MTPFQRHVQRWKGCTACELCHNRSVVVLCRGKIPCDVLFLGEAPGPSENALGIPFIGPAGKKMDFIIEHSVPADVRVALTNLVCCLPLSDGVKHDPPSSAIQACRPRLDEFIRIAAPQLVVRVGTLAVRHFTPKTHPYTIINVVHPSAIIQANEAQQWSMTQRSVITIRNACDALCPF